MKMFCPQCGVKGSADDSYIGRRIKCPKCGEKFTCEAEEEQETLLDADSPVADLDELTAEKEISADIDSFFDESESLQSALSEEIDLDDSPGDESGIIEEDLSIDEADEADEAETAVVEEELNLDRAGLEDVAAAAEELSRDSGDLAEIDEPDPFADETEDESPLPGNEAGEDEIDIEPALSFEDDTEEAEPDPEVEAEVDEDEFDEDLAAFFDEPSEDDVRDIEDEVELEVEDSVEQVAEEESEQLLVDAEQEDVLILEEADEDSQSPDTGPVLPVFEEVKEEASQEKKKKRKKKEKKVAEPRVFSLEKLTVSGGLKEAWKYVKGAKLKLLIGMLITSILPSALISGVVSGFPVIRQSLPLTDELSALYVLAGCILVGVLIGGALQAGLFYTAVRWVGDRSISLKHLFSGLPKIISIFFALLFMLLMVISGTVLLVFPGIYLAVGYLLTLPLIIDRGMHPWQAMEASRKAIHKVWWQVFGILIVMSLIINVSAIPCGIGLIWTLPMQLTVIGVIYRVLFGVKE